MVARAASQLFGHPGRPPLVAAGALAALVIACGQAREPELVEPDATALTGAIVELAEAFADRGTEAAADVDTDAATDTAAGGEALGEFRLTYYVMAREPVPTQDEATPTELGEADADHVAIHADGCEVIAEVPREFARDLRMQGSGVLSDGRLVSAGRACDCDAGGICFFLPGDRYRWGIGAANRSLSPFRSVAVDTDVVALGQTLYIPELEGLRMPGPPPWGGFVHDGCVVADDRGGGVRGKHIDFFAARRGYYQAIMRSLGLSSITVYDGEGRCDELGEGRRPAT